MKIVQVVQEFSRKGGIEAVAFELQEAWTRMNVPATVLAGIAPGSESRSDVSLVNAPFRHVATRGKLAKYFGRVIVIPIFSFSASKRIKNEYQDYIVLSHGDLLCGDAVIIHAVNKASIQAKMRDHNYTWLINPMHWWVGSRDRYMIGGLRYKRYIAISSRVSQELQTLYHVPQDHISIIPNGVNIDRFNPNGNGRESIRAELKIPSNAKVLLFVGHEFKRKGLSHIIEALGKMSDQVYLIVVGNDDSESYRKLARQLNRSRQIIFTGPRNDIPDINRACDAFVFPTNYEAFGLVTMEALASGIPIFSTKVGGIEDYLIDGVNGRFIERNGANIASIIEPVLQNDALMQQMKINARQSALSYSWQNIAKQYYEVLKELTPG